MDEDTLRAALRSIDAGGPVDWTSTTASPEDETERSTVRSLEIVSKVVAFHRALHALPPAESIGPQTSPEALEASPVSWGPLLLHERVGVGTFGEVFRAWDRRLDREVAVKLLRHPSGPDEPDPGVVQEGRQLARVRHPNVVTIHGADVIDGRVGIWMEFVRGRTLEVELHDETTLAWRGAAAIGVAVCSALGAVHAAGLVHRDISARNVMRDEAGRIVVMDFGAAHPSSDEAGMCGTPLYLAPELLNGQRANPASDVYAVGVLLYRMVSGDYPVAGADLGALREAHRAGRRVALRDRRLDLPGVFIGAVERALDPDPTRRFQSAADLEHALNSALHSRYPTPGWFTPRFALGALAVAAMAIATAVPAFQRRGWESTAWERTSKSEPAPAALSPVATRRVALPDSPYPSRPSLDGRYFPFIGSDRNVGVLELQTGRIRSLTTTRTTAEFAYGTSVVSPDSRFVAFTWADASRRSTLRVVNIDTGEVRVVWPHEGGVDLQPLEWSGDGRAILAMGPRQNGTVQIASIDSSDGRRRVLWEGPFRPMGASISPDGRLLVYDRPDGPQDRTRDIFVLDTDSGRETPLVTDRSNDLFPQWTPDGAEVLFASDRTGALGLWRVRMVNDVAARAPEVVERDMGRFLPLGLTRDGSFYYFAKTDIVDVYTADLNPSTLKIVGTPRLVTSDRRGSAMTSDWSPDGRYLAYVSIKGYVPIDRFSRALTIRDLATGEERDLWPEMAFFLSPRWSPDGRTILVSGLGIEGRSGIHVVDVASGRTTHVVGGQGVGEYEWSADGSAVLYRRGVSRIVSRDVATGTETTVLDFARSSADRLIARPGPPPPLMLRTFQVAPDGHRLAATAWSGDSDSLEASLAVGDPRAGLVKIYTARRLGFHGWTPDGTALLFSTPTDPLSARPSGTLWSIASTGGIPSQTGLEMPGLASVRISPDARRLTFTAGFDGGEIRVAERLLYRAAIDAPGRASKP